MNDASPVVKLIALAIVGGVAKSLFGQPVASPVINQFSNAAEKVADAVSN